MIAQHAAFSVRKFAVVAGAVMSAVCLPMEGVAQRPPGQPAPPAQQQAQQPQPQQPQPQPQQPAAAPGPRWDGFAPMVLERVFRGPLQDTLVQRWRDPNDGAVCFVYLPISAAAAGQGSYLVYGPNTIGSISCFAPAQVIQLQGSGISAAANPSQAPAAPQGQAPGAPGTQLPPRGR